MLAQGGVEYYDEEREAPYMISSDGAQWVGYDNPHSLSVKVDFLKSRGLRGYMVWAIELDDFRNEAYPCLRALKESLGDYVVPKTSTTVSPTSTTIPSTTTTTVPASTTTTDASTTTTTPASTTT